MYGANQKSRDSLKYFMKILPFSNGIWGMAPRTTWTTPSPIEDYMHLVSVSLNGKKAKILSHEDFTAKAGDSMFTTNEEASKDPFNKPEVNYPIATIGWPFGPNTGSGGPLGIGIPYSDAASSNNAFVFYYPGNHTIQGINIQQATARAVLESGGDYVESIDMIQFGAGYTESFPPNITITNPQGFSGISVILGTPNIDNEIVTSIPIVTPGTGYNEQPPIIEIEGPQPDIPNDILNIHYIRTPKQGRGSLEFNEMPHDVAMEIIKIATRMMTASIESSNYEVMDQELNKGV